MTNMARRREHGRILSVETMQRGSALAVDAAAAATSITVNDAGDFDEDGGWLYIGAQVVEFTACDDDTGVITLATGLTVLAEQGDPVHVYDPLYAEVVDYQVALVQLDGEHDNPDPVEAEVSEAVQDLAEGDRGGPGESCTLSRVTDDEWVVRSVGGRPRKSRGIRFEQDDTYVLTAADITAGSATMPLTHRPVPEGLTAVLAGVRQRPTNYTINYDAQTITWPLSGWEKAGDRIWVHYAYRKGITTAVAVGELPTNPVTQTARGSGGSVQITLTGVAVGDLIVIAVVSGGTASFGGSGFTLLESATASNSYVTITGVLYAKIATQADVDSPIYPGFGGAVPVIGGVVYRGARMLTSADSAFDALNADIATGIISAPAVPISGAGLRTVLVGIAGGSGQNALLTPNPPLTQRSEVESNASMNISDEQVTGSAAALPNAFTTFYEGGRVLGIDWPWICFSVAIGGA